MTERELQELFSQLCSEHGLTDWKLVFNSQLSRTLGKCRHDRREIHLSQRMVADLPERAPLTLRHEIAHAIAGPGAGHGPHWKAACRLVGAIPKTLADVPQEFIESGYKWKAVCESCGDLPAGWYARPADRDRVHRVCGSRVHVVPVGERIEAVAADNPREPDRESETYQAHMERIKRLREERRKA